MQENFSFDYVIRKRYDALCKNLLDSEEYQTKSLTQSNINRNDIISVCNHEISFFRINGISEFWKEDESIDFNKIMSDLLCGLHSKNLGYIYMIRGDNAGIHVVVGVDEEYAEALKSALIAMFPNINFTEIELNEVMMKHIVDGGIFTGFPTDKILEEGTFKQQIDNLCKGLIGRDFLYVVFAKALNPMYVTEAHNLVLNELSSVYEYQKQGINDSGFTVDKQSFVHSNYFENLQKLEHTYNIGVERGMWQYTGYFGVDNEKSANMFGNLIRSTFSGNDSKPEKMRVLQPVDPNLVLKLISTGSFYKNMCEDWQNHPLAFENGGPATFKFQTTVNSDQLGVLTALPHREYPGYYVDDFVEFDVSNRNRFKLKNPVEIGDIVNAGHATTLDIENKYYIEKNDYTRHCLIIGITGGGKTNTSKSLLKTLWCQPSETRIPFLVIESAKREYWELRNLDGFEDLMVYTLGSEDPEKAIRYRINPFETLPGISLQSHIDMLLATFKTAFELYPPMPYVLERAVYEVYSDRGWDIVTNKNLYGLTLYPTLSDLYDKIGYIVKKLGYDKELASNIQSALEARINSLMIGGKGAMLNTEKSVPIDSLLSYPTVLELEDIGDDETKSFVIGILLVQLYEYRKYQKDKMNGAKKLQHILMVEEAHRLLKNVSESSNPSQAKAVEFFCNMLAEIRTYGQGIFIADQIPTKLAPDTIKNTNLKIVHRTVAAEDRETIGKAMNMTESQINFLSSLPRGYAAVYAEGDNRPKCVHLPLIRDRYSFSRKEVIAPMQKKVNETLKLDFKKKHCGCAYCEKKCEYFNTVFKRMRSIKNIDEKINKYNSSLFVPKIAHTFLSKMIAAIKVEDNLSVRICMYGLLINTFKVSDGEKKKAISCYIAYLNHIHFFKNNHKSMKKEVK